MPSSTHGRPHLTPQGQCSCYFAGALLLRKTSPHPPGAMQLLFCWCCTSMGDLTPPPRGSAAAILLVLHWHGRPHSTPQGQCSCYFAGAALAWETSLHPRGAVLLLFCWCFTLTEDLTPPLRGNATAILLVLYSYGRPHSTPQGQCSCYFAGVVPTDDILV